ncbi:MAG: 16S rRNA (uracil(1498)-N(3))-methyltransferase [Desulfobulbaceae bacterium]|uniref:Ribosomal RNA small subunit methyltransferase E n=1 Tax=Candidatus Desulfatifera sulfidica TaxID=2841691 RepID=A0A8J6N5U0_9BACT|nr:16S rRNA (uracil(1498)-N(3))-methyltransferase [Candidatus Desulfatifera sulfidica]
MRRFFFHPESRNGDHVFLSEAESHHLIRVFRLAVGARVQLFDGTGRSYQAEVAELGERVLIRLLAAIECPQPDGPALFVHQALIRNKKMDLAVQKCTELGVSAYQGIAAARCQGGLGDVRARTKREERWQRIVEESCKQCARPYPMEIVPAITWADLCAGPSREDRELRLLFWEEEERGNLADLPSLGTFERIHLLIGPEGGLTEDEVHEARAAGYNSISLGTRILRAETAAISGVAIVQYLAGQM